MKIDLHQVRTVYINLDRHPGKNERLRAQLQKHGFRFERFAGIAAEANGCEKSHFQVLSSYDELPLLVLEDDCLIKYELESVEIPDDADALYLGTCPFGYHNGSICGTTYEHVNDKLVRIHEMLCAHAVVYISEQYKSLVKTIAGRCSTTAPDAFDKCVCEIQKYFKVYSLNDPLFYQNDAKKDTNHHIWSYWKLSEYPFVNELKDRSYSEPIPFFPDPIRLR